MIWIGDISIQDDQEAIIRSLRKALGMTASVDGARLDNATIGQLQVPGCLLYRLTARQKLLNASAGRRQASRSATPT